MLEATLLRGKIYLEEGNGLKSERYFDWFLRMTV